MSDTFYDNAGMHAEAEYVIEIGRLTRELANARAEVVRLRAYNEGLAKISADLERERDEARKENGQLRAAAILAFNEMCNTVAPRHTFTDAVDALDAVLYPNEQVIFDEKTQTP